MSEKPTPEEIADLIERYAAQADDPAAFRKDELFAAAAADLAYDLAPYVVPMLVESHPEYIAALRAEQEAHHAWVVACGGLLKPGEEPQAYKDAKRHLREVAADLVERWKKGPI